MASCPNCHQAIEIKSQHMGALFNCPHCRAVFFVDWNGQPEALAQHEPEPPPETPAPLEPSSDPFSVEASPIESPLEMPSMSPSDGFAGVDMPPPEVAYEPVSESPLEMPFEAALSPVAEEAPALDVPLEMPVESPLEMPAETPVANESFDGAEQTPVGDPFALEPAAVAGDEGMADVLNYGNQENAAGPLAYTVVIEGLELAETFEKLKEALTDSRFNWESDEVMAQVKAGRLELKGLNPTKASILINRIKYLPIEVSWKQEVYGGTA
ncbi:MAG: hypothetical protein KF789_03180 [Bdellovibrionaceae bacterium]|nr:hypothetical protein [Pseudobdellovibrionaceae bacterium]